MTAHDLLASLYTAHARGEDAVSIGCTFLEHLETLLTPAGVPTVDQLFELIELDRVPGSIGILLLASTRLIEASFPHRAAFVDRFSRWLLERDGRTEQDVEVILRGLR